ncbi:MAG TPA: FeoA family protein [Polyangiaceae bacterium]|jgi:Fe2+ transport system protein FeoA|nr:FeoA family protein [Polyangiaceae bacterium]
MKLAELPQGTIATVTHVGGAGSFRRRLMELGILPGTSVQLVGVAPLGDPMELLVRGASLSIRRAEALTVEVAPVAVAGAATLRQEPRIETSNLDVTRCARGTP